MPCARAKVAACLLLLLAGCAVFDLEQAEKNLGEQSAIDAMRAAVATGGRKLRH